MAKKTFGATRKFNKLPFHLSGSARPKTKSSATLEARRLRKKGLKARVVKVKGGYHTFGR